VPYAATIRSLTARTAAAVDSPPRVVDGAIDGEPFLAYVGQILVSTLRPGDTAIVDNLSSQEGGRASGHRGCRRPCALSAALQSQPKPDRAGVSVG
jgi:hypothetical protein